MLSSVVARSGCFSALLKHQSSLRALTAIAVRGTSTAEETQAISVQKKSWASLTQTERWDKANEIFYGPQRDKVNFPHTVMRESSGKVRMGFLPEEWFQFFYSKTGVTGPYVFGTGLLAFLFSKEIWVVDHAFAEVIGFWGAFFILAKKVGPGLAKYIDERNELQSKELFVTPIEEVKVNHKKTIELCEKKLWQQDGQNCVVDALQENVDLQLEAEYRRRLQTVYSDVKKRLDYQLDIQTTKRRFEQNHMVQWIVDSVKQEITPEQEKLSITRCISDLKNLARA